MLCVVHTEGGRILAVIFDNEDGVVVHGDDGNPEFFGHRLRTWMTRATAEGTADLHGTCSSWLVVIPWRVGDVNESLDT